MSGDVPAMYSREAERAVLGGCLLGRLDIVNAARAELPAEGAFFLHRHHRIWRAICSLADRDTIPDLITVPIRARELGNGWDDAEDSLYLTDLYEHAPRTVGAVHFREVARYARLRQMWEFGARLTQKAAQVADLGVDVDDGLERLIEDTRVALEQVGTSPTAPQLASLLLDSAGLDSIPDVRPLILGVLQRDSLAWLAGPPGTGKTLIALDMAGSIGTGTSWQGHATAGGEVLYIIAEGASGIRPRVRAWEDAAGSTMQDVEWLPVVVAASDEPAWAQLCRLVAIRKPALIVIDTQARTTVGWEENSARDMGMLVEQFERLRRSSEGACVLILHHEGHAGTHMRGSTALPGAATTILSVDQEEETVTISCEKQKDGRAFDPIALRLCEFKDSVVLVPSDELVGEPGVPNRRPVLENRAVRTMLSSWWTTHEDEWSSLSALEGSGAVKKSSFYRHKLALKREGVIEQRGEGTQVKYRLKQDPDAG